MAIDNLTSALTVNLSWTAQKNLTGTDYTPTVNSSAFRKNANVGTSFANNADGGGNELVSFIQSVANSGNTTIDLTSLTDILSQANTNLARVKGICVRLLSTSDDSTNGTDCTYITVGGAASNQFVSGSSGRGWLTTNSTFDVPNGGCVAMQFPNNTGVLVNTTIKNIFIANGDSGHPAAVQITVQGGTS